MVPLFIILLTDLLKMGTEGLVILWFGEVFVEFENFGTSL